jgi:large subunit ribosomal protein L21
MYAIIRDRGNQYRVSEGDVVELDLMANTTNGDSVTFEVLMHSNGDGEVSLGAPVVEGASVSGEIVEATVKGKKIDVVHFRRRKDSMSKVGHRQKYTRVKIQNIQVG